MKKVISFLIKIGQVLLIYTLMLATSIFLYNKFNKGKVIYGNRCTQQKINNLEEYLEFKEIDNIQIKQECNTVYLTLQANLTKEEYIGTIMKYYEKFKTLNYKGNIQIIATSSQMENPLFASITPKGISIN